MSTTPSEIPLFDHLKDGVVVEEIPFGLAFWWSRKGIGFGQITLTVQNGKLVVDTECMSTEFCMDVIEQAIKEASS